MTVSPLAPAEPACLPPVAGVRLATAAAEIKYPQRQDVMLAVFPEGAAAAGVFTRSATAGAPVDICRAHLASGDARALIVNSGNANAFTGRTGAEHAAAMVGAVAGCLDCAVHDVFIASTGVIGEPLPIQRILGVIPRAVEALDDDHWEAAARAIMTTDTFPKMATVSSMIGDVPVTLNGLAKGSGMIEPDMATLLAFVFTDARIPPRTLQQLLERANRVTFNCLTVDSDTSTSDTCMLFATGCAQNPPAEDADDPLLQRFAADLEKLMRDLAVQVARDGEGAGKLIEVRVSGAADDAAARAIGKSIANSPLVKTAIAGEDANWGRVVMAVGKSGQRVDRDRLAIRMGATLITRNGQVVDGYDEREVSRHLEGDHVLIGVDIGLGDGGATVWTCDLTHGYISINADYRS